jgi:two-component system response regulator LytT
MGWNVLIVDDEEPASEELAYLLSMNPKVERTAQAETGLAAIKKAKEFEPDVIFLDINLPDINGLQVAQLLSEMNIHSKIVFLTAYDKYAIDAFKLRAFHYILKPYDEDDLAVVFTNMEKKENKPAADGKPSLPYKLAIEIEGVIRYVYPKDIVYINKNKDNKKVLIHTTDKSYQAPYTLSELETKLSSRSFFRVHKSYLVNLEYVTELQPYFNGAYTLHLSDTPSSIIPVSRNFIKELRMKLEI